MQLLGFHEPPYVEKKTLEEYRLGLTTKRSNEEVAMFDMQQKKVFYAVVLSKSEASEPQKKDRISQTYFS